MARYLAGEMNMNEEIRYRKDLEQNPVLHAELNEMENKWKHINEDPSPGNSDTGKAWGQLYDRLESDGLLAENSSGRRNMRRLLRIAAAILLMLAIGVPSLYFGLVRDHGAEPVQKHFAENGVNTIDLPDGSRVFLNEGAEICYPEGFQKERSIELEGEAFFEVMSDPVNPFTVRSGKVVVSVLGTAFNVKKADGPEDVEVYVERGKVRVTMDDSGEFLTLESGEMAHAGNQLIQSAGLSDPNYISWKTKDFKFVDEELTMVLKELEESYHVSIEAEDVVLDDMRITTTYSEQSIDAILETIGAAFGLSVSKKEDQYYLKK